MICDNHKLINCSLRHDIQKLKGPNIRNDSGFNNFIYENVYETTTNLNS